ncbi:hypothetical protein NC653_019406 [Populus alba x Populus x berolinensis]|uniref:Uncharacterized protein n=1 Tax=Populus alba x Populus x berolinensis TaxID=444605 RepID=A0AAD6QIT9_9ROSI|nr:hypothetical protein NC653_019406 [Populus alba x Populus x berolinensis]
MCFTHQPNLLASCIIKLWENLMVLDMT